MKYNPWKLTNWGKQLLLQNQVFNIKELVLVEQYDVNADYVTNDTALLPDNIKNRYKVASSEMIMQDNDPVMKLTYQVTNYGKKSDADDAVEENLVDQEYKANFMGIYATQVSADGQESETKLFAFTTTTDINTGFDIYPYNPSDTRYGKLLYHYYVYLTITNNAQIKVVYGLETYAMKKDLASIESKYNDLNTKFTEYEKTDNDRDKTIHDELEKIKLKLTNDSNEKIDELTGRVTRLETDNKSMTNTITELNTIVNVGTTNPNVPSLKSQVGDLKTNVEANHVAITELKDKVAEKLDNRDYDNISSVITQDRNMLDEEASYRYLTQNLLRNNRLLEVLSNKENVKIMSKSNFNKMLGIHSSIERDRYYVNYDINWNLDTGSGNSRLQLNYNYIIGNPDIVPTVVQNRLKAPSATQVNAMKVTFTANRFTEDKQPSDDFVLYFPIAESSILQIQKAIYTHIMNNGVNRKSLVDRLKSPTIVYEYVADATQASTGVNGETYLEKLRRSIPIYLQRSEFNSIFTGVFDDSTLTTDEIQHVLSIIDMYKEIINDHIVGGSATIETILNKIKEVYKENLTTQNYPGLGKDRLSLRLMDKQEIFEGSYRSWIDTEKRNLDYITKYIKGGFDISDWCFYNNMLKKVNSDYKYGGYKIKESARDKFFDLIFNIYWDVSFTVPTDKKKLVSKQLFDNSELYLNIRLLPDTNPEKEIWYLEPTNTIRIDFKQKQLSEDEFEEMVDNIFTNESKKLTIKTILKMTYPHIPMD